MTDNVKVLYVNSPILECLKNIDYLKIGILPVVSEEDLFEGTVSYLDVADFFIKKNLSNRQNYIIRPENFNRVIKGYFFKNGVKTEFEAFFVVGAMPYEKFEKRVSFAEPENIVLITGNRADIIDYALKNNFPAIVLTGIDNKEELSINTKGYNGWIYISELDTAATLNMLMLSVPVKSIVHRDAPYLRKIDDAEVAKELLIKIEHKGLPVVEDGKVIGMVTRASLLNKKRKKVILVDHNESAQSVDGLESAEIIEIIDHHRLGTVKTKTPIYVYAKPVGSTSTLVYQLFVSNNVEINSKIAQLLLSGILSDTVVLKSPTTTCEDMEAAKSLSKIANIDYEKYGVELFSATENITSKDPRSVIEADIKIYKEFGLKIGISQAEVVNLQVFDEVKEELKKALLHFKGDYNLDWAMIMVTDIINDVSILLVTPFEAGEKLISYKKIDEHIYYLPDVLSRKKQLLPEILRILEEISIK